MFRDDRLSLIFQNKFPRANLPCFDAFGVWRREPVCTSFFLDARAKIHLLDLIQSGRLKTLELPVAAYRAIAAIIGKYADRDIDLADAALVWLAEQTGIRAILTVDLNDFGVYRLKAGKRFDVVKWYAPRSLRSK